MGFPTDPQKFYGEVLEGRVSREQCVEADCMHPCYGGGGASICLLCLFIEEDISYVLKHISDKDEALADVCSACHVPSLY